MTEVKGGVDFFADRILTYIFSSCKIPIPPLLLVPSSLVFFDSTQRSDFPFSNPVASVLCCFETHAAQFSNAITFLFEASIRSYARHGRSIIFTRASPRPQQLPEGSYPRLVILIWLSTKFDCRNHFLCPLWYRVVGSWCASRSFSTMDVDSSCNRSFEYACSCLTCQLTAHPR